MPYIERGRRIAVSSGETPATAGELNYAITRQVHSYIRQHGQRYETYNAVIGVLEAAKLELYRRLVAPYEDSKIQQNGDVTL